MTTTTTTELVELGRFFTIAGRRLAVGDSTPEMFGCDRRRLAPPCG
ncbi:hypothetical protein [Kitasatospora sp. NPDC047058]